MKVTLNIENDAELRGIIENSLTIEELIVNYNFYLTNTKG